MKIVDNVPAMRVLTNLGRTDRAIGRSTVRLSSGYRINTAGDDPAGFAISLKLRRQVGAMEMADRNTLDGTSLLETADAAMQVLSDMLNRIRELAVAAANDTYDAGNRQTMQREVDALLDEINDTTRKVEFNNIRLLDGEAKDLHIQVGGRKGMTIVLNLPSFTTWSLDLTGPQWHINDTTPNNKISVENSQNAQETITKIDNALEVISERRGSVGAYMNRFEYTSSNLRASVEATSRSLSRIMDTDMAYEMMELSKHNILSQAGMSIMAQLNARPQQVLQLLGR
ncbi:MAG: flagellin [Defluviitaleaceae bacterium]|nr:flagellin [Defluviitaleaceae bacterium]